MMEINWNTRKSGTKDTVVQPIQSGNGRRKVQYLRIWALRITFKARFLIRSEHHPSDLSKMR